MTWQKWLVKFCRWFDPFSSVRPISLYRYRCRYRYIGNLPIYRPISVPIFHFLKSKQTAVISSKMWTNSCHFFQKVNKQLLFLSKCKQTAVIFQKCKQTADIYGCVFTFRRIFLTVLTYDISVPILKDTDIYRPIPISEKLADIGRYRYRYRYRSNTTFC